MNHSIAAVAGLAVYSNVVYEHNNRLGEKSSLASLSLIKYWLIELGILMEALHCHATIASHHLARDISGFSTG